MKFSTVKVNGLDVFIVKVGTIISQHSYYYMVSQQLVTCSET
jgi:hypothetical protein